jgi:hypothetical protein
MLLRYLQKLSICEVRPINRERGMGTDSPFPNVSMCFSVSFKLDSYANLHDSNPADCSNMFGRKSGIVYCGLLGCCVVESCG